MHGARTHLDDGHAGYPRATEATARRSRLILDRGIRNAGTREEGEPGSQCGSRHGVRNKLLLREVKRVRNKLLLREVKIWGFLHTHKTAMVGNVLTPWGVIASFARVYTSSSAPQCERKTTPSPTIRS